MTTRINSSNTATSRAKQADHFHQHSSSSGEGPDTCPFEHFGCEFEPQSKDELHNHGRNIDVVGNHVHLLATTVKKLEGELGGLQDSHLKLQAKAENTSHFLTTDFRKVLESKNLHNIGPPVLSSNIENVDPAVLKLLEKLPLWNAKSMYHLFQNQSLTMDLKTKLELEMKRNDELRDEVKQLKASFEKFARSSPLNQASSMSVIFNGHEGDSGLPKSISTVLDASMDGVESVPTSELARLSNRVSALEKTCEDLKNDKERNKQLERFVMHLHERIKSLDCGRTGTFIWKITGFDAIFENAKNQHLAKVNGSPVPENSACDFCSPLFYTGPNAYLMYMRLYPFGCDSAAGNFVSLFVALSPGEYDGVLKWPFMSSIEISMLSQEDPADKWTQVITPGGNNLTCFQRPSSKSGNMSVGILHFIVHSKIWKDSPYKKNDTIYIEVKIRDNEYSQSGQPRAKVPRSGNQ